MKAQRNMVLLRNQDLLKLPKVEKVFTVVFKFPKDPSRQRTWKRIINQYRRKGSGDTFNIKSCTVVCEFHFKADEIKVYITW